MPFVEGVRPSDEEIVDFTIDCYINNKKIIYDAYVSSNFVRTPDGRMVCIDFGMLLDMDKRVEGREVSQSSFDYVTTFSESMPKILSDTIKKYPDAAKIINTIRALIFLQDHFPDIRDVSTLKEHPDFVKRLSDLYVVSTMKAQSVQASAQHNVQIDRNEILRFFNLPLEDQAVQTDSTVNDQVMEKFNALLPDAPLAQQKAVLAILSDAVNANDRGKLLEMLNESFLDDDGKKYLWQLLLATQDRKISTCLDAAINKLDNTSRILSVLGVADEYIFPMKLKLPMFDAAKDNLSDYIIKICQSGFSTPQIFTLLNNKNTPEAGVKLIYDKIIKSPDEAHFTALVKNAHISGDQIDALIQKSNHISWRDFYIAAVQNEKASASALSNLARYANSKTPPDQWLLERIAKHPSATKEILVNLLSKANKSLIEAIRIAGDRRTDPAEKNEIASRVVLAKLMPDIQKMIRNFISDNQGMFKRDSVKQSVVVAQALSRQLQQCVTPFDALSIVVDQLANKNTENLTRVLTDCRKMVLSEMTQEQLIRYIVLKEPTLATSIEAVSGNLEEVKSILSENKKTDLESLVSVFVSIQADEKALSDDDYDDARKNSPGVPPPPGF